MGKSKDTDTNNDGRGDVPSVDETREDRMRMFDELPKALRRFLANDAPYDFAVTPFWLNRSCYSRIGNLTMSAQRAVMQETAEQYGVDHPQARRMFPLTLKPRSTRKTARRRRIAVPRSYG